MGCGGAYQSFSLRKKLLSRPLALARGAAHSASASASPSPSPSPSSSSDSAAAASEIWDMELERAAISFHPWLGQGDLERFRSASGTPRRWEDEDSSWLVRRSTAEAVGAVGDWD